MVIQTHDSMLELLFLVYCFYTIFVYFPTCNKDFLRATWIFQLLKSNLCEKLRTDLCGPFA